MNIYVASIFALVVGFAVWLATPLIWPEATTLYHFTVDENLVGTGRDAVAAVTGLLTWVIGFSMRTKGDRVIGRVSRASSGDYTYGSKTFRGPVEAAFVNSTVYKADRDLNVFGTELARTSGNEIWVGSQSYHRASVKNGEVLSYNRELIARIYGEKVESLEHGNVYFIGAQASDVGKAAIWVALRY